MEAHEIAEIEPTKENLERFFPPDAIGPSWRRDEDGKFIRPKRTLGWHVISWVQAHLTDPRDPDMAKPFSLTPEQRRLVLWWYALDEDGNFSYRSWVLQRLKGWGKDPLAAVLCLVELIGPSCYSHDDDKGMPMGKPNAEAHVGLGAVSKGQTSNTFLMFKKIVPGRTKNKFGLDIQNEIIYANHGKQKLLAIGSSYKSSEGGRFTFFIFNETQHWTPGINMDDFYETMVDNLGKAPIDPDTGIILGGRAMSITNAFKPGEDSVAERVRTSQERVWAGLQADGQVLYDSLEAHEDVPLDAEWAPLVIEQIRGDAKWLDWKGIRSRVLDGSVLPSRKRRMWYNQIRTSEESAFSKAEIRKSQREGCVGTWKDLSPGDDITLGFDGSLKDDSSVLVAFRPSDRLIVPLAFWENDEGSDTWRVNKIRVRGLVTWARKTFNVLAFFSDVSYWDSEVVDWSDEFRETLQIKATAQSAVGYDMRGHHKETEQNNEKFTSMLREGTINHNGNERFINHLKNAEVFETPDGVRFLKKGGGESSRKIDGLVSATLAFLAWRKLSEKAAKKEQKVFRKTLLRK